MILYYPAVMLMMDSPRYARVDAMPLFGDFWMPAGYPMFLWLLRLISNQLWFTILVQHLLGLATGGLLYFALKRIGLAEWVACVPAAVVFFSGDHLYLEHMIMADFLLTFLTAAGLCAIVFSFRSEKAGGWLVLAGACCAAATVVRSVGVVLLPIVVVAVALRAGKEWRAPAAVLLGGLAVLGSYGAAFWLSGGQYLGLSDMRGWNLYSRVAPFADCRKFTPPPGTEMLCETRKPRKRPGPFGYVWDLESLPRKTFELGPATGKKLEAFAYAAIAHQPKAYVRAVLIDLARYVNPSLGGVRRYGGQPREILSFGWRDKEVEDFIVETMRRTYRGTAVTVRSPQLLASYQSVVRLHGILLLALFLLTIAGVCVGRGDVQFATALYGASAFGLYLLPVATVSYDFRYGIPPETFLAVSGVLGGVTLWQRRISARRRA